MKFKQYFLSGGLFLMPVLGFTQSNSQSAQLNSGDTAWIIAATALVMLMTPSGLALFYGGMTPRKNMLNTVGMSIAAYCLVSVVWIIAAFHLSFGSGSPFLGDFKFFLSGISPGEIGFASFNSGLISINGGDIKIPSLLFVLYQMTFAAITVALISGAVIERIKFSAWLIFSFLWIFIVYTPVAHWIWGGGFLAKEGVLDFAGGIVVHITAGISSLILVLLLGKRKEFGSTGQLPSSVLITVLGAMLLWFGWFGFNAGSSLAANGTAISSFLNTNTAGALGAVSWVTLEWTLTKRPTLIGIASGAIAGLAAITPASGFVGLDGAFVIGLFAGVLGYFSVSYLKKKFKYDDSLDAFGVHGICGIWGSIAVGFFANPAINPAGKGLFYGNPLQVWTQIKAVILVTFFSAAGTLILYYLTTLAVKGARVSSEHEKKGLDETVHGESGFHL